MGSPIHRFQRSAVLPAAHPFGGVRPGVFERRQFHADLLDVLQVDYGGEQYLPVAGPGYDRSPGVDDKLFPYRRPEPDLGR